MRNSTLYFVNCYPQTHADHNETNLTVKAKREEHEEEEYGPQLRGWQIWESFWVCDKRKAVPALCHICN